MEVAGFSLGSTVGRHPACGDYGSELDKLLSKKVANMLTMWNNRYLRAPPAATEKYDLKEIVKVPMMEARSKVFDLLQISEKGESLKSETVTLARLYYKFSNQWRREKCLGDIKQIEKCLKRFEEMQMGKNLKQLLATIPGKVSKQERDIYLPTKQLVEFTLLQLLGASALMSRTTQLCICAYNNLSRQMSAGLFVTSMMVITACVSRIWALCKSLLRELSLCYGALFAWMKTMRPSCQSLLAGEEVFPDDVSLWLRQTMNLRVPGIGTEAKDTNSIDIQPDKSTNPPLSHWNQDFVSNSQQFVIQQEAEDMGELVERTTPLPLLNDTASPGGRLERFHTGSGKKVKKSRAKQKTADIMKKVRKILRPDEANDSPPASTTKNFHILTKSECCDWQKQVKAADNVSQLHLVLKTFNTTFSGVQFRGLKKCLKELKQLKKTSRNMKKDRMLRRRENNKILQDGQKILRVFLKKNSVLKK